MGSSDLGRPGTGATARAVVGFSVLFAACGPAPEPDRIIEVRAHWWLDCAPAPAGPAVSFELHALGDFDPTPSTTESLVEGDDGAPLGVPERTRAVRLTATDGFDDWWGAGTTGEDELSASLWPVGAACPLYLPGTEGAAPEGQAAGVSRDGALLVFGGGTSTVEATSALLGDLDEALVETANLDPRERRSFATITTFGDALLVSGGMNPLSGSPLGDAEALDPRERRFDPEVIALSAPRVGHAGVVLASGETLLVGGRDAAGQPQRTLEILDPGTRRFRIAGLADLTSARIDPAAQLLDDGRVLVASGVDGAGDPVDSIEWLSPDATSVAATLPSLDASARVVGRAFAPMPGGGFLATGGCALREPSSAEASACAAACGVDGRCPSRGTYWVTADGSVTQLGDLSVDAPHPALIAGEAGRPWLSTGDPGGPRLLRFDPWRGLFEVPGEAPRVAPSARATVISGASGVLLWLEREPELALLGFRHSTRTPFTEDIAPFVLSGVRHLAPSGPNGIVFDAAARALVIDAGAFAWVADASYETVGVWVRRREGATPVVALGTLLVGSRACPWPVPTADEFRLARDGESVRVRAGEESASCEAPAGRVPLGVGSLSASTVIDAIVVRRTATLDLGLTGTP